MAIVKNILELIGKTPIIKLNHLSKNLKADVFVKLEYFNPMGSVKDRAAFAMIEDAEKKNLLNKDTVIIEPSSGNTGIALAWVCALKGYRLIITMPESMSVERRKIIKSFGAEIVLTPAAQGMRGSIEKANELAQSLKNTHIPFQFSNMANPKMHFNTTAQEIWEDMNGEVDVFIAGVGTAGTISGVSEALKSKNINIECIAVEPFDSAVISGGTAAPHKIQGIGAGFIPDNLNMNVIDKVLTVKNEDAIKTAQKLIKHEGIFCGISSGANVYATLELAKNDTYQGKKLLTIICDTAERYLSTALFE